MGDGEQGNGGGQQGVVQAIEPLVPPSALAAEEAATFGAVPGAPVVAGLTGPALPPGAVKLTPEEKARMGSMQRRMQEHKLRLAQLHLDVEARKAVAARDPATHLEKLANTLVEYEQRRTDILAEIQRQVALVQDQTSELARAHGLPAERGEVIVDMARGLLLPKTPPPRKS